MPLCALRPRGSVTSLVGLSPLNVTLEGYEFTLKEMVSESKMDHVVEALADGVLYSHSLLQTNI